MPSLIAQDRAPREGDLKEFRNWLFRQPGIELVAAREVLGWFSPAFSPTFSQGRRSAEDQRLIRDNLQLVYAGHA